MAFLRRSSVPVAVAAIALLSCTEPGPEVQVELLLYDQPVSCDAVLGSCLDPAGRAVSFENHRVVGYMSRAASQYGKGGLYLHFELSRATGAVAVVDLDVPAGTAAGSPALAPRLIYKEFKDGARVFDGQAAWGAVEVPMDPTCTCQDGRLELVFQDLGPDGKAGTSDDQVRRLSMGRFSLPESCRNLKLLEIAPERGVMINGLYGCPSIQGSAPPPAYEGHGDNYEDDYYSACAPPPDEEWEDGGCEGDTDDGGWDSGEGCGGDTDTGSSDDWSGEGCEGDSVDSSQSSSCEGDAYASSGTLGQGGRRASRWGRTGGFLWPVGIALLITARRRRRRGAHRR